MSQCDRPSTVLACLRLPSLTLGFRGLARRFGYTVDNPVHLPMSQRRIWKISVWEMKPWVAYRLLIATLSLGRSSSF